MPLPSMTVYITCDLYTLLSGIYIYFLIVQHENTKAVEFFNNTIKRGRNRRGVAMSVLGADTLMIAYSAYINKQNRVWI